MSRRLVLFRHAKSAWPEGVRDIERPLNDRGRRDAPAAGRWLRAHVPGLDLAACSPARRARETWALAAAELPAAPMLVTEDRIYQELQDVLLAVVRDLPADAHIAVLIGHNPGLSELVGLLSGADRELKTSAIAVLDGPGEWAAWAPGESALADFVVPRGADPAG